MLEDNDFVRCIFVDYCKVFDCVDHLFRLKTIETLFKSNVILWLTNFLISRSQAVMYNDLLSEFLFTNGSTVQSSGMDMLCSSYLLLTFIPCLLSSHNITSKYAANTI